MADVFDTISDWLLSRALTGADLADTLHELAHRLIECGVPASRIVMGAFSFTR